jgi:hypothetical protein
MRKENDLNKDMLQLSIYRYLLYPHIKLNDIGYTLFVSQSNNAQAAIDHELLSVNEAEDFITDTLFAIQENDRCDCFDNVKYNPCDYCPFECTHRRTK